MTSATPHKISYCTTCKGRLSHLKQTLPANLAAERDNPNVEFVLLDYDSRDGLADWIKANFSEEIASGRLRYARYAPAEHFKMAHAKNMAHRLAMGDILCNLDADNFIAPNFSRWLDRQFTNEPHSIVGPRPLNLTRDLEQKILWRVLHKPRPPADLAGRIAIARSDFEMLGGYDERFTGWGYEDIDFGLRARGAGLALPRVPQAMWGSVISHANAERITHLSDDDKARSQKALARFESAPKLLLLADSLRAVCRRPNPMANPKGMVGVGEVFMNFSDTPTIIQPLHQQKNAVAFQFEPGDSMSAGHASAMDVRRESGIEHYRY